MGHPFNHLLDTLFCDALRERSSDSQLRLGGATVLTLRGFSLPSAPTYQAMNQKPSARLIRVSELLQTANRATHEAYRFMCAAASTIRAAQAPEAHRYRFRPHSRVSGMIDPPAAIPLGRFGSGLTSQLRDTGTGSRTFAKVGKHFPNQGRGLVCGAQTVGQSTAWG